MKKILISLSTFVLVFNGCSNLHAELLTATPNSVSYQYDSGLSTGMKDAVKKAQAHCAKYGKVAELTNPGGGGVGYNTAVFECKKY